MHQGGGPPGATATAVHLSDQRAHAGGSSSLGMSPEKKSLIFLPMSPIGLSSAWVGREAGWRLSIVVFAEAGLQTREGEKLWKGCGCHAMISLVCKQGDADSPR